MKQTSMLPPDSREIIAMIYINNGDKEQRIYCAMSELLPFSVVPYL